MSLYLIILSISLAGPLAFSFEKNLRLYKRWKYLLPAILITMFIFVAWDIIFTHMGFWFFNPIHNSGLYIFKLPLEEYLFFIVIPYACAFSFYAVQFHLPKFKINGHWTKVLTFLIVVVSLIISLLNQDLTYTFVNFLVLPAILLLSYFCAREVVQYYLAIYPILLIPFFIINGILTGTGIEQAVFDYNPDVILGIRILSVPLEDMFYNFSLLLLPLTLTHIFEMRLKKTKKRMKIAVIGSGIGGLATACRLASKGHEVTVFEKNGSPGGKISEINMEGYRFDTGPSLFTIPELVDELYTAAGENVPSTFAYRKLEVLCKYFYNSGEKLIAWSDQQKFADECVEKLGEDPANITKYFRSASLIYNITADIFLFNSLHKVKNFLKFSVLKSLLQVFKIRFYKTMHRANSNNFKSPLLIQLFDRYATYNGSNPYKAPATLNVIAHLENNLGTYFPEQGMYTIVRHIYELALKKGVRFKFNSLVTSIEIKNKEAVGIRLGDKAFTFDNIVSDSDINYVINNLMDHPFKKRFNRLEPSSSALVFYWGVNKEFPELDLHNILFSGDYKDEFTNLFQKKTIATDPTVYIFVSSKMVKSDAPKNCENWFVMVNAPANSEENWDELIRVTKQNIIAKINKLLKTEIEDYIEHEKIASPITIEQNTLSKGGALYGNSSNSIFSAFLRHPNFLKSVKNLYFVGGSVHPGGGIPLCLASAKIVSNEIPAE